MACYMDLCKLLECKGADSKHVVLIRKNKSVCFHRKTHAFNERVLGLVV